MWEACLCTITQVIVCYAIVCVCVAFLIIWNSVCWELLSNGFIYFFVSYLHVPEKMGSDHVLGGGRIGRAAGADLHIALTPIPPWVDLAFDCLMSLLNQHVSLQAMWIHENGIPSNLLPTHFCFNFYLLQVLGSAAIITFGSRLRYLAMQLNDAK